jgi:HEAT repeat protein
MTIKSKTEERKGVSGFISKVLNESGNAIIGIYDGVTYGCSRVKDGCSRVKDGCVRIKEGVKKTPEVSRKVSTKVSTKAKQMYNEGKLKLDPSHLASLKKKSTSESIALFEKIRKREKKIAALYYRIGKEGTQVKDQDNPLEQESVKKLIADVRGYENEIERLKKRIADLESEKVSTESAPIAKKAAKEPPPKERNMEKIERARQARARIEKEKEKQMKATLDSPLTIRNRSLKSVIQGALKTARFQSASEKAKFETVANDLLDAESEIRMLAASEMAKIGNQAAVNILMAVARDKDPYLVAETLNSLIQLKAPKAVPLLNEKLSDTHYRIRMAALRGLYKLADVEQFKAACLSAIKDDHPEVRKTAITFIGWKDYSEGVPPLVQCLKDDDERVKQAAIAALGNIRDKAAVMPLIKLLNDQSLEIREKSHSAIQMIVGEEIPFDTKLSGDALSESQKRLKEWWQQRRINVAQEPDMDLLDVPEISVDDVKPTPKPVKNEAPNKPPEVKPVAPPKKEEPVAKKESPASKPAPDVKQAEKAIEKDKTPNAQMKATPPEKQGSADTKQPDKEELKKLPKEELIAMSKKSGIQVDDSFTKNRIIRGIMDKSA